MMLYISSALWLLLIARNLSATLRVLTGNGKDHDVLAFSYVLVAMVMLGFSARWMFSPDNYVVLDIMRVFSSMLAIFMLLIARFYRKWG